jgi:SAM-dependent methyltransferase
MSKQLDASNYDTDKSSKYLANYERFFEAFLSKEVRILELGIRNGGSLLLWRDYFEKGKIVGLDLKPVHIEDSSKRIITYYGRQEDTDLLDRIGKETAPEGFDIIIDDCSHIAELTRISFWHLFDNHLKPGGLYVIEDWGTGYINNWVDGRKYRPYSKPMFHSIRCYLAGIIAFFSKKLPGRWSRLYKLAYYKQRYHSHDYGMVGFVKQLIDECGMSDITKSKGSNMHERGSKFQEVHIFEGQVFVIKSQL